MGWEIPAGRSVVAEVYPSLWSRGSARENRTDDQPVRILVSILMAYSFRPGKSGRQVQRDLPRQCLLFLVVGVDNFQRGSDQLAHVLIHHQDRGIAHRGNAVLRFRQGVLLFSARVQHRGLPCPYAASIGTVSPNGALPGSVEAHITGYDGSLLGKVPARSVRKIIV